MKPLISLVLALIVVLSTSVFGVYYEERFDYPNGGVCAVSSGKWLPWDGGGGPADDALVTNATPFCSAGSYLRLSQFDAPPAGWQEVVSYIGDDIFKDDDEATIGFSFAAAGCTNQDYYLWFCSGDPSSTNSGYTASGLGAFIVNWVKPAEETNFVSLHLWNDLGIYQLSLDVAAEPASSGNMVWHDIRAVLTKDMSGGITGGTAAIYLDGELLGGVPFPLQNIDNNQTGIINCLDFYASNPLPVSGNDRCLVDNIFIQDTHGYTRYVAKDGSDANDGLSETTSWATIAHALWELPSGCEDYATELYVGEGVYTNEHIYGSDNTNGWKYGLYIRGNAADRPNCYWVSLVGDGANNTIMHQDFSMYPEITGLEHTMGFYIRDLKGWTIEDFQVRCTTNMPEDAWAWYYGLFCYMGCEDSEWDNCIAQKPVGWAKGKGGFTVMGGDNVGVYNCLGIGGGMGMNVAWNPPVVDVDHCTFVGVQQGTGEGNSGVGIVYNGYSGTVTRCLVSDCSRAGVLGGLGDIIYSVENNINTNNGSAMYEGDVRPTNDIAQVPIFQTYDGYPYRCGAGNIGYMGAYGQTYYVDINSPIARGGLTLGLTPGTAFKSPEDPLLSLWDFDGLPGDPHKISIAAGVYTNCVTLDSYAVGGLYVRRGSTDRPSLNGVDMFGDNPTNTILYSDGTLGTYKDPSNTWTRAGDVVFLRGVRNWTVRDLQARIRNANDEWAWYYAVVNAAGCSNVLFQNLVVDALGEACGNGCYGVMGFGTVDSPMGVVTLDHCLGMGLSFGLNMHVMTDPAVPTIVENCTFSEQNLSTGEGLSPAGIGWNADDTVVDVQNAIIASNTRAGIVGNASVSNAVVTDGIFWDVSVFSENPVSNVDVMVNTVDPLLADYNGYPRTSPYSSYGWRGRPLEDPVVRAAEPWPLCGNGPQRKGYYTGGMDLTGGMIVWTNTFQVGCGIWGSGVADANAFYMAVDAATADSYDLLALDLADGSLLWGTDLEDWANGTPAVSEEMVFIGDAAGYAYGVAKANGLIVWQTDLDGGALGGVMLNGNRIYIEADGVGLYCLNAVDGSIVWTNVHANASTWSGNGPPMSPARDALYYHTENGDVLAVDAATGATTWQWTTFGAGWGGQEPIVDDAGNVYCALGGITPSLNNDVLVSFAAGGTTNWVYDTGMDGAWWHGGYALSPDGSTVYLSRRSGAGLGLEAVNTADGSQKWQLACGDTFGGCVVVSPGDVVVGVFDGGGMPLVKGIRDGGTAGTELWSVEIWTNGLSWSWPTVLPSGDVIVESDVGVIARITVPEPGLLAGILGLLLVARRMRK